MGVWIYRAVRVGFGPLLIPSVDMYVYAKKKKTTQTSQVQQLEERVKEAEAQGQQWKTVRLHTV